MTNQRLPEICFRSDAVKVLQLQEGKHDFKPQTLKKILNLVSSANNWNHLTILNNRRDGVVVREFAS